MEEQTIDNYITSVLENMPDGWLTITTHRLDIYDESLAKVQFLEHFNRLYESNDALPKSLSLLPTAYDYIRLGHPLSCILEWTIAKDYSIEPSYVISFASKTIPILAILRKNSIAKIDTRILYSTTMPEAFNAELVKEIYGYEFKLQQVDTYSKRLPFDGTTIFVSEHNELVRDQLNKNVDFVVSLYPSLGSVLIVNGDQNKSAISDIQHVRRRETVAMTPANCLTALKSFTGNISSGFIQSTHHSNKKLVKDLINQISGTNANVLVGSSGLSIQYAIMMGLIHNALVNHKGKDIKIIVPTNCYGGTNDQARRVAACFSAVEVVDLAVDGENDMVQSIDTVLTQVADQDAVPYLIAEIPTNPRVEVPDLGQLQRVLTKERMTSTGQLAVDPVFILDQTFCPNVHFLGEGKILSSIRTIAYASGSKFPSGGLCTAGYCVGNSMARTLIDLVELHLTLCDNEATELQYKILANQLPSMKQRISDAYENTKDFVDYVSNSLPSAKINFVSDDLANQGFTPSVFSLDLPTKGKTEEERETYKRAMNLKLINMMITEIPDESKFCVSYGQLKGCYWTIPATSTQGTTKEGDKDYIIRASLSPNLDLDIHKKVFQDFVNSL